MTTRKTTSIEQDSMEFLNGLRESGATNMFGATPYLMDEFPELSKPEAREIMSLWMKNFNDEGNYETVKK
jgi:hypothetical protein